MLKRFSSVQPRSVGEVSQYLEEAPPPRRTWNWEALATSDWGIRRWVALPYEGLFKSTRKLVGPTAELDTVPHQYAVGELEGRMIGRLTIGEATFGYDATDAVAANSGQLKVPTIISAGVLQYLEGFDPQASDNLLRHVAAIESAQNAHLYQ